MRLRYVLRQPHKVNRVLHQPGEVIELPQQLGDWLVAQGICLAEPGQPASAPIATKLMSAPDDRPRSWWNPPRYTGGNTGRGCCGR